MTMTMMMTWRRYHEGPALRIDLATLTPRTDCSEHYTGFVYFYRTRMMLFYPMQSTLMVMDQELWTSSRPLFICGFDFLLF